MGAILSKQEPSIQNGRVGTYGLYLHQVHSLFLTSYESKLKFVVHLS